MNRGKVGLGSMLRTGATTVASSSSSSRWRAVPPPPFFSVVHKIRRRPIFNPSTTVTRVVVVLLPFPHQDRRDQETQTTIHDRIKEDTTRRWLWYRSTVMIHTVVLLTCPVAIRRVLFSGSFFLVCRVMYNRKPSGWTVVVVLLPPSYFWPFFLSLWLICVEDYLLSNTCHVTIFFLARQKNGIFYFPFNTRRKN